MFVLWRLFTTGTYDVFVLFGVYSGSEQEDFFVSDLSPAYY